MGKDRVYIVKVVSKNVFSDILSTFKNFFGANLTPYEKMVDKGMQQIETDLELQGIELDWFRYEITQLTSGALTIVLYGESKK